jgi:hypothetical protein
MPWRNMGECGYSSTILNLGIRWRWAVSFTPRPLYPLYSLDRRLDGPQTRSELWRVEKILYPCWESNPGHRARRYTDWAIPAHHQWWIGNYLKGNGRDLFQRIFRWVFWIDWGKPLYVPLVYFCKHLRVSWERVPFETSRTTVSCSRWTN